MQLLLVDSQSPQDPNLPMNGLNVNRTEYTHLKKCCRVKSINDGQCDTMELWEDDRGKFVIGFCFVIFKIFSFQVNLKSKLRHAVLL